MKCFCRDSSRDFLYPVQINREITSSFFFVGKKKRLIYRILWSSNWSRGISKKCFDTIEHLSTIANYWKAIPDADDSTSEYITIQIWIIRITTAWKELNNNYKYSSTFYHSASRNSPSQLIEKFEIRGRNDPVWLRIKTSHYYLSLIYLSNN